MLIPMAVSVVPIFDVGDYEQQVRRGAETLDAGGLVVLPTETVYGAAGRVDLPDARRKLSALRGEAHGGKPFTVHVARREDAGQFLGPTNHFANRLMRKLWPGPVGLVFDVPADRRADVAKRFNMAEHELYDTATGTIVLRCPDDNVAYDVLRQTNGPAALVAVGGPGGPALRAHGLADDLEGKADLILDAGPTRYSKPSTLLKVAGDHYELVRQGVYDERIIEKMLKTTILFVCSGNTCRSPMAEALARRQLAKQLKVSEAELEKRGVAVTSAGSFALPGARATPQAVEALRGLGADLSGHRSKPLSVELIHQADMIYTMGRSHAQAVRALVPSASDKVATLDPGGDIEDPIGSDTAVYVKLAGELDKLIEKRFAESKIT